MNLGLISRYVGSRDDLVRATFADLSDKLTAEVRADPTAARGFESDSVMVCWTRILSHLVVVDPETAVELGRAPMEDLVAAAQDVYGQSEPAARPLADEAIALLLARQGVNIARRTVAKYREQLGIAPARERRRQNAKPSLARAG